MKARFRLSGRILALAVANEQRRKSLSTLTIRPNIEYILPIAFCFPPPYVEGTA